MLEKGWNPRLPEDTLRKDLIQIHPPASRFNIMLDKVKSHLRKALIIPLNMKNRSGTKFIKYLSQPLSRVRVFKLDPTQSHQTRNPVCVSVVSFSKSSL
ncbi:hypothetical protein O181_024297 [Austropuccinia psidii MF-1]|uniref:Uncharacterized protein n=1 Tax=Austropuccinia psidii MF-1 TaxID=1389203 RepID=A0A9Q3CJ28_9BASI|nr:hypothetical protein [Austropuccinia psidii MF-1]